MSNLGTPSAEWLVELFEYEYCAECGGDADDHAAIPFLGNWFARCEHPLPEELSDDAIDAELRRRRELQDAGGTLP